MLAFSIIAVVLDIILGLNAILMFANLKITSDIQGKTLNLVSCALFVVLETTKLLIEICTGEKFVLSSIIIAVYVVMIIMTIYSICKKK